MRAFPTNAFICRKRSKISYCQKDELDGRHYLEAKSHDTIYIPSHTL